MQQQNDQLPELTQEQKVALYSKEVDGQAFGELISLPGLFGKNKLRVENARLYTDAQLKAVELVDMKTVDVSFMETLMVPVVELRSLLTEAKKEIEEDRKPHTQKMDAIKSLFTSLEKDFDALTSRVKSIQDKWELEKLDRHKKAEEEKARAIQKAQDKIRLVATLKTGMLSWFATMLVNEVQKMSDAFYEKTAEDLPVFGESLRRWEPFFDTEVMIIIRDGINVSSNLHTLEEINIFRIDAIGELNTTFASDWSEKIREERDRLIDLIPSRIAELKEGNEKAAAERIEREKAALASEITSSASDKAEVISMNAESDKMAVVFEESAKAEIIAPAAKGSVKKKKYAPTTHKAFAAILQQWVSKDMALLTIDELTKKLSFMITAANKRLNEGETLEATGLNIVDDISTRSTKSVAA